MALPPWNPAFCPSAITERGCRIQGCPLVHYIYKCSCGLVLVTSARRPHEQGKRHRKLLQDAHPGTQNYAPPRSRRSQTTVRCEECNRDVLEAQAENHARQHTRRERAQGLRDDIKENEKDKNGLIVSPKDSIDFGLVEAADEAQFVGCTVIKTDPSLRISLNKFTLASSPQSDEHGERFSVSLIGSPRWIHHRDFRTLLVQFHPSEAGVYNDTLQLLFYDLKQKQSFVITRPIRASVGSKEDHETLKPSAPYTGRNRNQYVPFEGELNFNLRPPVWSPVQWKQYLPKYDLPEALVQTVSDKPQDAKHRVKGLLPPEFSLPTYTKHFQTLLHIEEVQLRQDLENYAMEDVELKPHHPRYHLEVEGLGEGRPSVLVGDFILVRHTGSREDAPWDQGCVHEVYENYVSLRFGDQFSTYRGTRFDVRFVLNRLPVRRMHFALENKNNPRRLLFPEARHLLSNQRPTIQQMEGITPFNRNIGEDAEQLETVTAILNQPPGSPPFVVFGPPGTGKTVTIVEAIRQLLDRDPECRILACTPNNSAADLIAQRLSTLGPTRLLRLNSMSRKFKDLPKSLHEFSCFNSNQVFAIPSLEQIVQYRVVVSTCITGGVPSGLGVKRGYYSHIFVDEAGQAKEPEVMIPIKTMADRNTNIVLAGDPMQLGPIIHSPVARDLGLKISYLYRMMGRAIYSLPTDEDSSSSTNGRGITVVKLVKNFRTHPSILEFSNAHFYDGELQPVGNPALTRSLENWEELPKKQFPVIFHSIHGKDQREASSPSFFNINEASQVKKYCLSLIGSRRNAVRALDIIVITPYHAQVMKLRLLFCRDEKLKDIRVGSVEQFQGQESRVVIMTTVRSSEEYVSMDVRRSLGFVANPQRLNVALTRAQALLIVIGNPMVLGLDPYWRSFIDYVHTKGGWRGRKLGWVPSSNSLPSDHALGEGEEMVTRLRALIATATFDLSSDDDDNPFEGIPIRRDDE